MDYGNFMVDRLHTVVAATTDDEGLPVTCAIDIMDADGEGLYFLTAKGKGLYRRLKSRSYIAFTGVDGRDTLTSVAVSVRGKVRELGSEPLARLLVKNPYMKAIYPTEASQAALTVFQLYEGSGEWFDLSKTPIERAGFSIGHVKEKAGGYRITGTCNGCRACEAACPRRCIDFSARPAVIRQEHCLRCGNCQAVCPQGAVLREG